MKHGNISTAIYSSPIGNLEIAANDDILVYIRYIENSSISKRNCKNPDNAHISATISQLTEYFSGKRTKFDLPIKPAGSEFQNKIWNELKNIPFSGVTSYGELGEIIGKKKSARAVGAWAHSRQ